MDYSPWSERKNLAILKINTREQNLQKPERKKTNNSLKKANAFEMPLLVNATISPYPIHVSLCIHIQYTYT